MIQRLQAKRKVVEKDPQLKDPNRSKHDLAYPPELYQIDEEIALMERLRNSSENFKTLGERNLKIDTTLSVEPDYYLRRPDESEDQFLLRTFLNGSVGYEKIEAMVEKAGIPKERLLIRFFSTSREDLLRRHGSDRTEIGSVDQRQTGWWDEAEKIKNLGSQNLDKKDAIYASPMSDPHQALAYYREFLNGNLSMAIFDSQHFHQVDFELFTFRSKEKRKDALVGIVRSPLGDARIRSLLVQLSDPTPPVAR